MDNKNDSYFYLGGLISTLILLLVFVLFSYALFFEQESKSYALTKDNSINVSLVMDTPKKNIDKNANILNLNISSMAKGLHLISLRNESKVSNSKVLASLQF